LTVSNRILVAGGAGFLGSHLVDRLLKRGDIASLVIVDNLWTGSADNLAHIADPRISFVNTDLELFLSDDLFDEIYHFASPASPLYYMAEPVRTISANVVGAIRALALLKPGGLICYASTSEVYGEPLVSPQPESYRGFVDCTGPRSSYDESKRCTEALLFEARRAHGVRVKVVRLFNVYGPRTRVDDGRAVSNFISQALRDLPLTVFGDGQQSRSWGYVDDIMSGLERFFWLDGLDECGPLNLGNAREIPVIDIARYIQGLIPNAVIEHLPASPQDPTSRRPDLTLAHQFLPGWDCHVACEDGVQRTTAWFRGMMGLT